MKTEIFSPLWPWQPTRIRWIRPTKTYLFKTALKNGDFWKRRFAVLDYQPLFGKSARAHENGVFWKRLRHGLRYLGMRMLLSKMVPFFKASWDRFFFRVGKNAYKKTATYRRRSFSKRNKKFCIQTNRTRMDGYRIRCRLLSVDRILARRILMRCIVAEVHFSAGFISYTRTFKYWSLHWSIDLHGFEYFIKWTFTRK